MAEVSPEYAAKREMIVRHGAPELVQALDRGMSVTMGRRLLNQPPEVQAAVGRAILSGVDPVEAEREHALQNPPHRSVLKVYKAYQQLSATEKMLFFDMVVDDPIPW